MKTLYTLIILFLLSTALASSQGTFLGGSYSLGIPTGGLDSYISAGSWRGANFEGLKEIKSNFAVGWSLGWNVFYEKRENEVYTDDNLTVTGTQYRYMNLFPLLARGLYQFGKSEGARPFFGTGLGLTADLARTNVGLYSFQKTAWHFTVAPELGVRIPLSYTHLTASVRYTYGVKTKELGDISYISVNLGALWGE